jgi:hypothetical protein
MAARRCVGDWEGLGGYFLEKIGNCGVMNLK